MRSWDDLNPFQCGYISEALDTFGKSRRWRDWTNTRPPLLSELSESTFLEMIRDANAFFDATMFLLLGSDHAAGRAFWISRNDLDGSGFGDGSWDPSTTTLLIAAQATGEFRLVVDRENNEIVREN